MKKTSRNAFTLIEMLVVIAIIGMLAALMFPAINKALLQAKITRVRQEALSIAAAIDMYWNDYGQLPVPANAQGLPGYTGATWSAAAEDAPTYFTEDISKSIIQVLIAEAAGDNANNALNPRRKVYLSMQGAKNTGELLDAWGKQYFIKLDRDLDDKLEYYSGANKIQHRKRSIVVSAGPDRIFDGGTANKNAKDNVANVTLLDIPK